MKSNMSHQFSKVPMADIQRSTFDRSHAYKTTFDSGYLIPFYIDEVLPGDTFKVSTTILARLATPIVPIMDNMYLDTFYFAVPLRLLWDNFEKFMGSQVNPGDSTDFTIPQVTTGGGTWGRGTIWDYFGLPMGTTGNSVSAMWSRAYNLIFNEWFRDQNLQNSVTVDTDDGPDLPADYALLRRGKRHDYFTSCLPWPQKGVAVNMPLGDKAYIKIDDITGATNPTNHDGQFYVASVDASANNDHLGAVTLDNLGGGFATESAANLYADLTNASAATINSLRESFQLQRMLERDARGGTRYTEVIKSHFGVTSPDSRLQRPEYLGGGSTPVNITPVEQTGSTDVTTPQGNLAGFGTIHDSGKGFNMSFTEHAVIIGICNIRADLTYQECIPRMFSRSTRYDFYWPSLAHLGEQAVLNKEIFASGVPATDAAVFGYQERYAEYRYYPSKITGQMRSNDPSSLDIWHLSQEFLTLPVLNDTFIQDEPPVPRIVAVPSEPQFILDAYIECKTTRPMPTYSTPGMIDHF